MSRNKLFKTFSVQNWNNYFETMPKIFKTKVDVSPTNAIFGVPKIWTFKQLDTLTFTS